jgi:hypothetical protein
MKLLPGKMRYYRIIFPLFFFLQFSFIKAQKDSSQVVVPHIKGYLSDVGSVMKWNKNKPVWDNSIQNRLNFAWEPVNWFDVSIQLRTRFLGGQTQLNTPAYAKMIETDRGLIDLSKNLYSGKSILLNSQTDRLFMHFKLGQCEITAGRQRINWGQTYVWNPNDIFNAYSFFEFDYPEKPGSDALRFQYFNDIANSLELVLKADSGKNISLAGLLKFNKWNYDIQFLGGILDGKDYVAGTGWSGNIGGAGFKGEASYFHPRKNPFDTSGMALVSLSLDYNFSNSWYLMGELLYRYQENGTKGLNLMEYLNAPASVKNLAITDLNLLVQLSVPMGALVNSSWSFMLLPGIKGVFAGPSMSMSISDNIEASASAQLFNGSYPDPITNLKSTQHLGIFYLRLKWNF